MTRKEAVAFVRSVFSLKGKKLSVSEWSCDPSTQTFRLEYCIDDSSILFAFIGKKVDAYTKVKVQLLDEPPKSFRLDSAVVISEYIKNIVDMSTRHEIDCLVKEQRKALRNELAFSRKLRECADLRSKEMFWQTGDR